MLRNLSSPELDQLQQSHHLLLKSATGKSIAGQTAKTMRHSMDKQHLGLRPVLTTGPFADKESSATKPKGHTSSLLVPSASTPKLSTRAGAKSSLMTALPSHLVSHFSKQEIQVMKRNLVSLRQKSSSSLSSASSKGQGAAHKADENPY